MPNQTRALGVRECASECFFSVKPTLLKPQKYFYLIFALHPGASTNFIGTDHSTGQPVKYCECSVMQVVLCLKLSCAVRTKIHFTHAGDTRAHFILIPDDEGLVAVQKQYTAARVVTFKTVLDYKQLPRELESPLDLFRSAPPPPKNLSRAGRSAHQPWTVNLLSKVQLPSFDSQNLLSLLGAGKPEPWYIYFPNRKIRAAPF